MINLIYHMENQKLDRYVGDYDCLLYTSFQFLLMVTKAAPRYNKNSILRRWLFMSEKKKKRFKMPHSFVIVFTIIVADVYKRQPPWKIIRWTPFMRK